MVSLKVPYLKVYRGKGKTSYYFAPPAYVVKQVYNKSNRGILLTGQKLSDDLDDAIKECLEIYAKKIKPYLKRGYEETANKYTFEYIWQKFCERRGIGCEACGNGLLDKPLSERTKKDYQRAFYLISKIKNEHGRKLITINADLITPQVAERIYLRLFDLCKEAWARSCRDLLRLLFNYGKHRLGVLHNNNPFENMRIQRTKNVQHLWTMKDVEEFNATALKLNDYEIGLAVRLNFYLGQRPADFLKLSMEQLKEKGRMHYFEIIPAKTEKHQITSYAPVPPDIYEEIKERTGQVIQFKSMYTFLEHFNKVRAQSRIDNRLTFKALRNSAATAYYEAGSSAAESMTILGHKQINTNMTIYRQNTPEQAINALEKRLKKQE